ncbi:sporulation protein [Bacillus sp. DNRA2]|uniref:sporulation protein n=1 Tax=Bacillus sp. DNRA2 TaxID=2723053 RepID=UPI00145D3704|nr:sporulation protein [Bacillus sp. DNRA2]NMD69856.1 sporulation protein [Bacillus sp. DNRA2]
MMLRKYMSLMGIGSAQVDLIINKNKYRRAEIVKGHINLIGGTVEQKMKRIECDLIKMNPITEVSEVVDSITILAAQQIESGELSKIEFQFTLPETIEKTSSSVSYHFKTKLIFDEGVKSLDHDPIFLMD